MKKQLLIIQNYNPNKGDSSVITAMLESLKLEGLNIELTSFDPSKAISEYNVHAVNWLVSYKNVKLARSKFRKLICLLSEILWVLYSFLWIILFRLGVRLWLPSSKKEIVDAYLKCDVVVLPGGHFFTNLNKFPQVFSHFWGLYFAKLLRKKTMIYAQTIGPFYGVFGPISHKMTNFLVNHTDIVTVREKESFEKYENYPNVFLTAETVFFLENKSTSIAYPEIEIIKKTNRPIVGVTIHHIYYKRFYSKEQYIALMSSIFDIIIYRYKCSVLLIPMESKSIGVADRELAHEMRNMMSNKDSFYIIENDYQSSDTASIISQCNIFVGTKTHSIVYGLKYYVPTLAIAYQQKSTEFMRSFNVVENSIRLDELNVERFFSVFDRIFNDVERYQQIQKEAHQKVIEDAGKNNILLMKLFEHL